jgi:hypothetical protein
VRLFLGSAARPRQEGTIAMANQRYFQLKATPGLHLLHAEPPYEMRADTGVRPAALPGGPAPAKHVQLDSWCAAVQPGSS